MPKMRCFFCLFFCFKVSQQNNKLQNTTELNFLECVFSMQRVFLCYKKLFNICWYNITIQMLNSNCIPRAFITRLKLYCNPAHWNFQWKGTQSGTQWIQYSDINLFILISKNHGGCLYLYLYLSLSYFVVLISTLFF